MKILSERNRSKRRSENLENVTNEDLGNKTIINKKPQKEGWDHQK